MGITQALGRVEQSLTIPITGVFEGGGTRGIALAGAAMGAQEMGYRFDQTVGTSAGALVSALLAAGYVRIRRGRAPRHHNFGQLATDARS